MGKACRTHGENQNTYRDLVEKAYGKRPLVRHRRRWEGNIKVDHREMRWSGSDWICLAQDRDHWRVV
jgi:hypothetical protein